jgi:hypothetical protein
LLKLLQVNNFPFCCVLTHLTLSTAEYPGRN